MNKKKAVLVPTIAAGILLALVAPASAKDGNGSYAIFLNGQLFAEGNFTADPAGLFVFSVVSAAIGEIGIDGKGDPFLSYEWEIENTTDEMMDGELFVTIDIEPIAGGLPALATLEVEVTDPGGEGVDMEAFHVTVLQGNDATFPTTSPMELFIQTDVTQAGATLVSAGPALLPDPLPVEGTSFIRLQVIQEFGGLAPGDTAVFRGSTVIVPEPGTLTLFALGVLLLVCYSARQRRRGK